MLSNKGKITVLAIPDLHEPFGHRDNIPFLKWIKAKYKPDKVVFLGDEADMHALSDYDHDPDGMSPGDELKKTISKLQEYYELFPQAYICTSNHTSRPYRRAHKFGIPKAYLRSYSEFLQAPKGWEWRDHWDVDGVRYEHGEGQSGPLGALKAALANGKSTVIGHLHTDAGIQFWANEDMLLYGVNSGCLIDRKAYAFAYGIKLKKKPILGVTLIEKGIPKFIPMLLLKSGRWARK